MSSRNDLQSDVDIDLAGLLAEIWKRKFLILALSVLTGIAIVFALSTVDPRYRSTARIIIENRESVFTRPSSNEFGNNGSQFDEQGIGSQVQILTSDDLALRVIEKLDLTQAPEFRSDANPSMLSNLFIMTGLSRADTLVTPQERVLSAFRERLSVYAPDKSRVIQIEFWAHDPRLAQAVPNTLAEEFLAEIAEAKLKSTAEATEWLGPEIEEMRKKLREAESRVAEFRANSDILIGNNNALLATQQLSEVSSELSRVRSEKFAAEGKVESIQAALESGGSLDVIPEVIASPLIQRLREREGALQAQISELSTTLLPNHPRLQALQSQVAGFRSQLRNAASDILTSLENNADLYAKQEAVLLKQVDRLKAEAARVGEAEVELRALEREAAAQRELLQSYLTQFREAASRQNARYLPVDARIISRAVMPAKSYFPNVLQFAIAGAVTMFVLTIVAILAWALLSGRALRTTGMVTSQMVPQQVPHEEAASAMSQHGVPQLSASQTPGMMASPADDPFLDPLEPSAMPANDDPAFAFRYALEAIENLGSARIAVIAPGGDSGSLAAWHLARRLSQAGNSVVIADLTGSAITSKAFLGSDDMTGLRDMLAGIADFRQAIYRDQHSDVHILPVGTENAANDDLDVDRLTSIADTLEKNYDYIIFDCGYAGPDGLFRIADEQTLVLISSEGAQLSEAQESEREFRAAGYDEAIIVRLENEDREQALAEAA